VVPVERVLMVTLMVLAGAAWSAEGTHQAEEVPRLEKSESNVSAAGFSAMLLATPDSDWQQKWDTPPETVPRFAEAKRVQVGQKLFILTFIANPLPDRDHRVDVACAMKVTRADGSLAVDERDIPCLVGELKGDLRNVRLSPAVVQVTAEESDPVGEYVTRVEVTDRVRGVTLTLVRRFTLEK
jgi:hypothetical protein